MKYQLPFLILLLVFLNVTLARADFTQNKCGEVLTSSGVIQINRQYNVDTGVCFLDLHPRNSVDLKYRDYYFDNEGHMLVFNSYGDGPDSQMTGARDYFLFPIVEDYPDYSIEGNGDVIVKLVSGHLFRISGKDFSVLSLTPGTVSEKALSPNNKGGIEIQLQKGFWLDGGFKKGDSPMGSATGKSILKSAASPQTCTLTNKEFLNYTGDGEYEFKFKRNEFVTFLKKRCPQVAL